MIIAIDYDGTVADTNTEKSFWIRENLGRDISPWDCDRSDCVPLIGEEAYVTMGNFVYDRPSTLKAGAVPGSGAAVKNLAESHTLYLLSARGNQRLEYAKEKLQILGLYEAFSGFTTSSGSSKAEVCHSLGAATLVDDDPRHLMDSNLAGITRILIQHGRPQIPGTSPEIQFCSNWEQVIQAIDKIEER